MPDDLVERLRAEIPLAADEHGQALLAEAADALEQIAANRDSLLERVEAAEFLTRDRTGFKPEHDQYQNPDFSKQEGK